MPRAPVRLVKTIERDSVSVANKRFYIDESARKSVNVSSARLPEKRCRLKSSGFTSLILPDSSLFVWSTALRRAFVL
jgi:hypothetical protein